MKRSNKELRDLVGQNQKLYSACQELQSANVKLFEQQKNLKKVHEKQAGSFTDQIRDLLVSLTLWLLNEY